ncbi:MULTISPECIES: hypothetical protein [Bacillus]|uniref:hypothetical protein n=1 Tax=Bacillus TaxID=1386 RepID=UPI0012FC4AC8|nr:MULTISPECIES: hypothetical protein [Bacillus]MCW1835289.1 hypothetical protein [Bacillus xiamenensis]QGX64770.1 hypothetical protein GPA07_04615 [Bacillus sp. ms-22]
MKITSKTIIGSILMFVGLSIFFGGSLGGLIPTLIGAWLIYAGVKKYDKGSKTTGVILAVIGVLLVVQSLPFLLGIAFAAALLYFGWKMINGESTKQSSGSSYMEPNTTPNMDKPIHTSFDQEWEDFLKKK